MWKVYQISSGHRVRGGFPTETAAKDWMERQDLLEEDFDVEEMDEEEEEEFLEAGEEEDDTDLIVPFGTDAAFAAVEEEDDSEVLPRTGTAFDPEDELEESGFSVEEDDEF